jgi:hypothetical protein
MNRPCVQSLANILVVTDLFTRWVETFPVKGATTKTTVKLLENEVFCRWGYPQAAITDNGTQFKSNGFKRACHRWRIRHWPTANYYPRANPTERRNQEIKKLLPDQPWDRHLQKGRFNIRRCRNAAIGQSPSHLLMGYDLLTDAKAVEDGLCPSQNDARSETGRSSRPPATLPGTIHPP